MVIKSNVKKWLFHFFITFPILSFIVVSVGLFIFIYWPVNIDSISIDRKNEREHVILISHGLKDSPETWSVELANALSEIYPNAQVLPLNWSRFSDNPFTCSVLGKRIGENIAATLLRNSSLKKVHLIGHSCGAFVNWGACSLLKEQKNSLLVKTTYLDPVSIYGSAFWDYGIDNFGSCADVSDTYFDTQDNVLGSNQEMPSSPSLDVTNLKEKHLYKGSAHLWPVHFYLSYIKKHGVIPNRIK